MKNNILSFPLIFFNLFISCLFIFPLFPSSAEDYPIRPISIIVPFAPGGVTDISARACTSVAEKYLGQPVAVVNKQAKCKTNIEALFKELGYLK